MSETTLTLPEPWASKLAPLFEVLSLDQALGRLVVPMAGGSEAMVKQVQALLADEALANRPDLAAGLWLYVDELDRSHRISQGLDDQTGSYWHAIMHRREGDFGNCKYWFRRTGHHPAMDRVTGPAGGGYDPDDMVDRVEAADGRGENEDPALAAVQREEWARLFEWCCEQ